jgi:hypothetical protein
VNLPSQLSELPLDTPLPLQVWHEGRQRSGQVLLASTWKPGLESVCKGKDFCIVFLTHAQEVPPPPDPRLVVVVPGPAGKAIREKSPHEEARVYGRGTIVAQAPFAITPQQVFSIEDNPRRFELLARALLEHVASRFPFLPQAEEARRYLEGMDLPEGEMALDKTSLLEQLSPDYLLRNPHLWESIQALFTWLRSQYAALYRQHHRQYHQEISSLRARLEEKAKLVQALARLNSLAALGEPLGTNLAGEYQALLERLKPCQVKEVPLEEGPTCPSCHLDLTATPPQAEVEAFLRALGQALNRQLYRLSRRVIGNIMAQEGTRLEKFIRAAQVADLSDLPELLDDEVLAFIRELLKE